MTTTLIANVSECKTADSALIRFEGKRECYTWVKPDDIYFVISADHYVNALIKCGKQKKWMSRHCTIKELLATLSTANFIRLNKFYLLNCNYFSRIDESRKKLFLKDNFSIPVPHRISPYIFNMLKITIREMHFTK